MKKALVVIGVLIVGYLIVFKTPYIFNRTATYSKWTMRYIRIHADENGSEPGIFFSDDKPAMMDDYVHKIDSTLRDLVRYFPKSGNATPTNVTMAWRENCTLYVINPSCYTALEDYATTWTVGLKKIRDRVQMPITDQAFYEFALMYFDKLIIRSAARDDTTTVPDTTLTLMYGDDRDELSGKRKR